MLCFCVVAALDVKYRYIKSIAHTKSILNTETCHRNTEISIKHGFLATYFDFYFNADFDISVADFDT